MYLSFELVESHVFDRDERAGGTIQLSIKYTPDIIYLGEKIGYFESLPEREPVRVGKAQSKNIFSCFDR